MGIFQCIIIATIIQGLNTGVIIGNGSNAVVCDAFSSRNVVEPLEAHLIQRDSLINVVKEQVHVNSSEADSRHVSMYIERGSCYDSIRVFLPSFNTAIVVSPGETSAVHGNAYPFWLDSENRVVAVRDKNTIVFDNGYTLGIQTIETTTEFDEKYVRPGEFAMDANARYYVLELENCYIIACVDRPEENLASLPRFPRSGIRLYVCACDNLYLFQTASNRSDNTFRGYLISKEEKYRVYSLEVETEAFVQFVDFDPVGHNVLFRSSYDPPFAFRDKFYEYCLDSAQFRRLSRFKGQIGVYLSGSWQIK